MSSKRLATNNNQLPEGYKKTEVGVIPEDWEYQAIGEAFEIRNNLRLPISKEKRQYIQGKYPYYGPTNVQDYIDEYRVEGEHALIGEDGDHFLKWRDLSMTLLVDGKFNVNNHAHIIKGVKNLTAWFYYFFAHRDLTQYLKRQGAGRYKLDKNTLINIPCAIPPLREQKAIAQTLSDVDALIASLDKHIAKKRNIKTGTMQQLLTGKTRLPGLGEGKGYKKTDIGVIPEDWKVTVLGKIASFQGGYAFSSRKFCESGRYQIVKMSNLYAGELNLARSSSFIDEIDEIEKAYLLKNEDILISLTGTVGKNDFGYTCRITNQNNLLLNQRVARIIVNQNSVSTLIELETKLSRFRKQFFDKAKGGTGNQTNVSTSDIAQILIPLPPTIEEQRAIAQVLSDIDTEITALEKRRAKTQAIKQGMMQELLTGRTRLKIEHPDDPITKNSNG